MTADQGVDIKLPAPPEWLIGQLTFLEGFLASEIRHGGLAPTTAVDELNNARAAIRMLKDHLRLKA